MAELKKEDTSKYTLFPIKYPEVWNMYKKAQKTFWTAEEIDLTKDKNDWAKMTKDEQFFIKHILAFFAGSDGIVLENLATRFIQDIEISEVRQFYAYQAYNEAIHSETYSLLIDTYIQNEEEKKKLFNAIQEIDCVKQKADWALKWMNNDEASIQQRLFAFALVEGVFFSGSFCAIYWLRKKNLMPGLTFSNELISKDEGLHTEFAILLYNTMLTPDERLSNETIISMVREAVDIEKNFICKSLPCALIGMNSDLMSTYIEFVADRLIMSMGYDKIYDSKNPFDFMEMLSLRSKTNFFEKRVGDYKKSGVKDNHDDDTHDISFEATF